MSIEVAVHLGEVYLCVCVHVCVYDVRVCMHVTTCVFVNVCMEIIVNNVLVLDGCCFSRFIMS